jgi:hypothetical protein
MRAGVSLDEGRRADAYRDVVAHKVGELPLIEP